MVIKKTGIIVKFNEKEKEAINTVKDLVKSMYDSLALDGELGKYEGFFTDNDEYLDYSMLDDFLSYLYVLGEVNSVQ